MSVEQRVAVLRTVAARVRAAMVDLRLLASSATAAAVGIPSRSADPIHVAGCGALIHSWYNELEKTFEVVARRLDGFETRGDDWHSALAAQVALDVPGLRPAMIGPESFGPLRDLRAFRHLFRHLYVLNLDPRRVAELLTLVETAWKTIEPNFGRFATALEALAEALEAPSK